MISKDKVVPMPDIDTEEYAAFEPDFDIDGYINISAEEAEDMEDAARLDYTFSDALAYAKLSQKPNGGMLLKAHKIINGERQGQYGSPEQAHSHVADYWSVYLSQKYGIIITLSAKDVEKLMTLFKIARDDLGTKADSILDACGYLGLVGDRGNV
jgi:hypothetical protein